VVTEVVEEIVDAEFSEAPSMALESYSAQPLNLFGASTPRDVIAAAADHAAALADVVNRQKLFAIIKGKKHVTVDGWELLGSMVGIYAVLEHTERIEIEGTWGWKATVSARKADGSIVGRADALCMRSEKDWSSRDEYALCSMAQTRATSKALRAPLGFIVKLAGFSATPEAEIPTTPEAAPAATTPTTTARPAAEAQGTPVDKASTAQHRKYRAILAELERDFPRPDGRKWDDLSTAWMRRQFAVGSHTELSKAQMSTLIERTNEHLEAAKIPFGNPVDEKAVAEELEAISE
jgi:hypothetical protein